MEKTSAWLTGGFEVVDTSICVRLFFGVVLLAAAAACTTKTEPAAPPAQGKVDAVTTPVPIKNLQPATVLRSKGFNICPFFVRGALVHAQSDAHMKALLQNNPNSLASLDGFQFDFSRDAFLLVNLGDRPNAGYRIELAGEQFDVQERRLQLTVRELKPHPDTMLRPITTTPCLAIQVRKGTAAVVTVVEAVSAATMGQVRLE